MVARPFHEIFDDGGRDPAPAGFRAGDLIVLNRLSGADPQTGELPESLDAEIAHAFRRLQALLERAGASLDNAGRVGIFLASLADLKAVNERWLAVFPNADDRPTYKFLQTRLDAGRRIELDCMAVAGRRRTLLAIDGVAHTNPIPLAVKVGPMLFSSRVLPVDLAAGRYAETPERQAALSFAHARRLVELAGGTAANITQIRAFVQEPGYRAAIEEQVRLLYPEGPRPFLEVLHYPTAGPLLTMIEIVAAGLPVTAP